MRLVVVFSRLRAHVYVPLSHVWCGHGQVSGDMEANTFGALDINEKVVSRAGDTG